MKIIKKLVIILCLLEQIFASKILLISVFPGKSHWLTFEHIIRKLLYRGHEITTITNYKFNFNNHSSAERYNEILIDPSFDIEGGLVMKDFFESTATYDNAVHKINLLHELGLASCRNAFQTENVRKFVNTKNLTFDLVIAEQFVQESFLMFAHKYKAPLITINTLGYSDYIDHYMGLMTPYSFVPHYFYEFSDRMSFMDRNFNLLLSIYELLKRKFDYLPRQYKIAQEAFITQGNEKLPSIQDLEKNVSVILVNSHVVINPPRPKIMGMIDIAGIHIRPVKKLPENLQNFLDSAQNGLIYINFGTWMRSSEMPETTLNVFLKVFKNLSKYKFLWKWETDRIPNIPENVMLQKWIPQNDVLSHPNLKIFVTHGGIFGTQEAIYHAKPMIFVPFYGDQHGNARKFEKAGVGVEMTISNVTVEEFHGKIVDILGNSSHYENIERMSQMFRDNPTDPMEEAIFWIEYVLKYRGAPHIKSAAIGLSWYEYLLLDVIGFWTLLISFVCLFVCKLIILSLNICCKCLTNKKKDKTL